MATKVVYRLSDAIVKRSGTFLAYMIFLEDAVRLAEGANRHGKSKFTREMLRQALKQVDEFNVCQIMMEFARKAKVLTCDLSVKKPA